MANQKPDAGQFDDVGFLIFRRPRRGAEYPARKRLARLSPYLTGE
jgi:hypothetical protein